MTEPPRALAEGKFYDGRPGFVEVVGPRKLQLSNRFVVVIVFGDEPVVEMLVASGLASSKRDARQALKDGAVRWNGEKLDGELTLTSGTVAMLQKGKRNKHLIVLD